MKTTTTKKIRARAMGAAMVAFGLLQLSTQVHALSFQPSEDVKVDVDTTLTYGRQWRTTGRDKNLLVSDDPAGALRDGAGSKSFWELVQRTNGDDGNRNFEKGDVVSSRFSGLVDIDASYKNVGFFVRPQIFYDEVPYGKTSWDCRYVCDNSLYAPGYENGKGINNSWASGESNNPSHFGSDYQETLGYQARFLDAYAYGSFGLGDHTLTMRVGRQVISWGEALMLQGGIAFAQNRMDASAATAPGVDLKEVFLPTGAVYGSLDVTEKVTVEAYWQYEWIPTTLLPTGSFFSMQDMIDGDVFLSQGLGKLGTYPMYRHTVEPNDNNQFGFATRYLLGEGTELAAYLVNYTDKAPSFWAANKTATVVTTPEPLTDSYAVNYFDNIRMYGLTLNTVVGGVQTGIEYAYRANAPIQTGCSAEIIRSGQCKDPSLPTMLTKYTDPEALQYVLVGWPVRAEIHTLNVGGTYIFQPNALWDTAMLVGEVGGWYVGGFENGQLQFAPLGGFTKYGEGMSAQFVPEYKNVMEGVDLAIPFFMNYGIDGSLSTFNYNEHGLWMSVGAEATYLEHWKLASYYNAFSGPDTYLWGDRDNVSFNVKYIF